MLKKYVSIMCKGYDISKRSLINTLQIVPCKANYHLITLGKHFSLIVNKIVTHAFQDHSYKSASEQRENLLNCLKGV